MKSVRTIAVSGVRNEAHALHVSSWVSAHLPRDGTALRVIDLDAQYASNPTSSYLRKHLPRSVELLPHQDCIPWIDRYVAVGSPGIKPLLRLARTTRRMIPTTAVDEGLGSYASILGRYLASRREGQTTRASLTSAAGSAIARLVLTNEEWRYFTRDRDLRWKVNPHVAEHLRSAARRAKLQAQQNKNVVVLTQPWVDLGCTSEERHLSTVSEIAAAINSRGFTPVICPHPLELSGRYREWTVTNGPIAELDPVVLGASKIIGGESTATLLLAAVLEQPVLRINMPGAPPMTRSQAALFAQLVGPARTVPEITSLLSE